MRLPLGLLLSTATTEVLEGGLFWKTFSGKEIHTPPKKQTLVLENYRPPVLSTVYYKYDCAEFARLWRRPRSPSRVVSAAVCARSVSTAVRAQFPNLRSKPARLRSNPSLTLSFQPEFEVIIVGDKFKAADDGKMNCCCGEN